MYNKNIGLIIYIKKIKDNDLFIRILSKDDNIITGIVYGGNSSKKKLIYQLGYFIEYNIVLKNDNLVSSINAEIVPPFINSFFNDKFKAFSLLAIISLLNLSIIEGQKIKGLFFSIQNLINTINTLKHWIIDFFEWLFYLLQIIGYQVAFEDKSNFKYYNLEIQDFVYEKSNQNTIEFPHELFNNRNKAFTLKEVRSVFTIFENIFQKNHLNNFNAKMPTNFINFRNLILDQLEN